MATPLKNKVKDYDNTLAGRLVREVENKDSVGFIDGRWLSPKYDYRYDPKKKNYDIFNFGMGIDRKSNEYVRNGELQFHTDNKGREYLTIEEERNARNHSLANAEESYNRRVAHAQKVFNSDKVPSEMKKALTMSAIYNLGQGTVSNELFEDKALMNSFLNGTDLEYSNHINRYFDKYNKGDRGPKTNQFVIDNSSTAQQPDGSITKEDVINAAMFIPNAVATGMGKIANYVNQTAQKYVKSKDNGKDNTVRWAEGGFLKPKDAWDALSMKDKADMIGIAVRHGITTLSDIRDKYNEFAEGGNTEEPWTMQDEANYRQWRSSLPENLRDTNDDDYDMRGAFKAGMQPTLESDGKYHLQSRDPKTGRILKASHHPTFLQAIAIDASMGYYPRTDNKGQTYTQTWRGNEHSIGGPLIENVMNDYRDGGGIHIKPSHRGRLTELKKRTGKTEAELYRTGSPATRKMITFARNARKWKHGDGGNLFLTGGPEEKGRGDVTNLSTWDELAAQSPLFYTIGKAIDPTGISGYGDAREAINQYDSSPSLSNGYTAVMETLGALPIVSKAGKAIKFLQGAVTGQGVFDDYNYAQEKKKEYGDELVVDYWDNTVKPRREAERHGEQMKSKMAYTDVHHVPSFKLAPKGSKLGQVLSNYDINHRVVKKYKKAISQ